MPCSSFHARSLPFELVDKLSISGGYSAVYSNEAPALPVFGDWRRRYCSLADSFLAVLDRVHEFEVRADDVWVVTSTKCGTTWTQEMAWLLMHDCDFAAARKVDLTLRSPFLEFNGVVPNVPHDTIEAANRLESPRLIKSHLPAWLLPKQVWLKRARIIYVFRDPRDAAVSYFHHWRGMVGYAGSKEDFVRSYIAGCVNFNPFWPHVLDFWQLRHEPHVLFTSYERMQRDLGAVVGDVSRFLQKPIAGAQLKRLLEHLSFANMQNNAACNHVKEFESMKAAAGREVDEFRFVRRGIVGSHKDELPPKLIREFDEWCEGNLKRHDLTLDDFTNYAKFR